jgi:hypothetical protein
VLRAIGRVSTLARWGSYGVARLGADLGAAGVGASAAARLRQYEAILGAVSAELRRARVPGTVVYLPERATVEGPDPTGSIDDQRRRWVLERAEAVGLDTLDPLGALRAAHRSGGPAVFLPAPEIHLSQEGHRVLSTWLWKEFGGLDR